MKLKRTFRKMMKAVSLSSPDIAKQIKKEIIEQRKTAKFIASENYNSLPVLMAMSSPTVDKYSEGYVEEWNGHRYYQGCEQVDKIEQLAVNYAKQLFGAEYAFVQPCSGSDANLIAYYAMKKYLRDNKKLDVNGQERKPKLLSLMVECGGHLTHSNPENIVNELYEVQTYKTNSSGYLDYEEIEKIAIKFKPDVIVAGASAYPRKIDYLKFRNIANLNGSLLMADIAHVAAFCIKDGVFKNEYNPINYCDVVTSTTQKTLRAGRGGLILSKEKFKDYFNKSCPMAMGGPLNNMIAAKAVGFREALTLEFRDYAREMILNAKELAYALTEKGISLQTGGTDNHMILVNLTNLGITGRQAELALAECNIIVNRNSIPDDPNGLWYCSGIRLGVPALTTRGVQENDMKEFGKLIAEVLKNITPTNSKSRYSLDKKVKKRVKYKVSKLLKKYPLYPELGRVK